MVIAMTNKNDGPVGYKRPPVATQFKPGQSGNPSGRPKRVKNLQAELLDELGELTRIREGVSELEISKARAIAKALVRAAVDGNMRAVTVLVSFCARTLGDTDEQSEQGTPEDVEILDDFVSRELRRRAGNYSATDDPESKTNEGKE
jgi:hypothetical protein